ncbi:RHS repeat-associated core domain-containing protein [Ralstonia pseudosolanacearum]|uniref:RHS repeat-associated core domain-containing protein n=1 Tax=Ralstonia pseudosolanacearum TaxID=1310165 RepID=UPI001FFDD553|nr:RHS repeat-associated core domain-containing protein [Ralstonia pseudosolanacearum]
MPGQSDTLRTQYDALGRPTERRIGSLGETWTYDPLGRQVGHGTPLGQFSYAHLGETGQTSSQQLEGSSLRTAYRYEDNRNDRRLKAIDNTGAMKGGLASGFGERDQDQDALAGSLHMQGGRMPMGDGWHDGGRWNEGDRWHEGGRHGDYGHHERAPWPPFGHGHGHGGAMGARASSFFYETDAENRIVSMLEAGREGPKPHWYRYDAADRLLADDSRSWNDRRYSYDAADNRTGAFSRQAKQTIVANALNQMQTVNGQPTQYDVAGNLLEDEARQYDWDAEHRLIRIRYKAQAGKETRFGYDGLGRRTVITEVDGTGTTETHYIWCGEVICQKRDANGQLLRAYYPEGEYGPEIGKRVAKADAGIEADEDGDERYGRDRDGDDGKSDQPAETTGSLIYARNHLGSVTDTLTPNGRAVTHTEYGPYGELVKSQGRAEYRADFGYAGMQYHAASGMYLTLFRAYDPGTGRWVSRDPIGERGGINLYAYVDGNPLSNIDPRGLQAYPIPGPAPVPAPGGGVSAPGGSRGSTDPVTGMPISSPSRPSINIPSVSTICLIAPAICAMANVIAATSKPGSKPKDCPSGTRPIDKVPGLGKDEVHDIKGGVGAGPRDWTGIAPNGDVITGDSEGNAVNHGNYNDYLP